MKAKDDERGIRTPESLRAINALAGRRIQPTLPSRHINIKKERIARKTIH